LVAGATAPVVFVASALLLTIRQRSFLDRAGWSAVARTEVEWPSILSLGPDGSLMTATFIIVGALGMVFAASLFVAGPQTRVVALLVSAIAAATGLEALPPDALGHVGAASWHDRIHDGVYPLIPTASIAAATAVVFAPWAGRRLARASLIAAAAMALAALATFADSVAQLARFFSFGAVLTWVEVLALSQLGRPAGLRPRR
jgi:hypothetical protein